MKKKKKEKNQRKIKKNYSKSNEKFSWGLATLVPGSRNSGRTVMDEWKEFKHLPLLAI